MTAHPFTAPTEVVLAQFGPHLYVALRSATMRVTVRPDAPGQGNVPNPEPNTILATLSCPCGAELDTELNATTGNGAVIARYCLPTGHCTFIRLHTPQPPCVHWQPIPFDPATKGPA